MTEQEVFAKIIEVIQPTSEVTYDTLISDSDDFDSLNMLNVISTFKAKGIKLAMRDLVGLDTVGDLVKLIVSRSL